MNYGISQLLITYNLLKSLLKMAIPAIIMAVFAILGSLVLIIFICCPICKGYKRNKIIMFIILGVALGFTM